MWATRWLIVLTAVGSLQGCAHSGTASSAKSPEGRLVVLVTDANGVPVAGAEVFGSSSVNPGPVASFCCVEKVFDRAVSDEQGLAVLDSPPFTMRPILVRGQTKSGLKGQTSFGVMAVPRNARGQLPLVLTP